MRHRWSLIVVWVMGVVNDFLEADVVVVMSITSGDWCQQMSSIFTLTF